MDYSLGRRGSDMDRAKFTEVIEFLVRDKHLVSLAILKSMTGSLREAKERFEKVGTCLSDYLSYLDYGICDMCTEGCVGEYNIRDKCKKFKLDGDRLLKFEDFCRREGKSWE